MAQNRDPKREMRIEVVDSYIQRIDWCCINIRFLCSFTNSHCVTYVIHTRLSLKTGHLMDCTFELDSYLLTSYELFQADSKGIGDERGLGALGIRHRGSISCHEVAYA